jgi:hypothetical protein
MDSGAFRKAQTQHFKKKSFLGSVYKFCLQPVVYRNVNNPVYRRNTGKSTVCGLVNNVNGNFLKEYFKQNL